jgi:large subunit ribosomal protein L11
VRLLAYNDRTYKFLIKPPPTSWFIKRAIGKEKLTNHRSNVSGTISIKYIYEIAKIKKEMDYDLATTDLEGICKSIVAQCQGMGVIVGPDQDDPQIIKPKLKI